MTNSEIIDAEFVEVEPGTALAPREPEPSTPPPPASGMMSDTLAVLGLQRQLLVAQHQALCDMLREMKLPTATPLAGFGPSGADGTPPSGGSETGPSGGPLGAPIGIMENNMRSMDRAMGSIMDTLRRGFGASVEEGHSRG